MDVRRILRSSRIRVQRRVDDLSPAEARRSRLDARRLEERFAWMAQFPARSEQLVARFDADHAWYIRHVGHPHHAASLELVLLLQYICERLRPGRLVDLGSGFTSYVLRRWAAEQDPPMPEAWSVDDSPEWLDKTRSYLHDKGMSDVHTHTWADFRDMDHGLFDLVLHDMGSMAFREQTLDAVLALVAPGGLVVLDDVHKPEYREAALALLDERGLEHYSLKSQTRDRLTRYAELVVAPG